MEEESAADKGMRGRQLDCIITIIIYVLILPLTAPALSLVCFRARLGSIQHRVPERVRPVPKAIKPTEKDVKKNTKPKVCLRQGGRLCLKLRGKIYI